MTLPAYGTPPAATATLAAPTRWSSGRCHGRISPALRTPSPSAHRRCPALGRCRARPGRPVGLAAPAGSVERQLCRCRPAPVAGALGRRAGGLAPLCSPWSRSRRGATPEPSPGRATAPAWTPGSRHGDDAVQPGIGDARLHPDQRQRSGGDRGQPRRRRTDRGGAEKCQGACYCDTGNGEVQNTAGVPLTCHGWGGRPAQTRLRRLVGNDPVVLVHAIFGAGRLSIVPST